LHRFSYEFQPETPPVLLFFASKRPEGAPAGAQLAESQRPDDRAGVRDDGRRVDGRGTLNIKVGDGRGSRSMGLRIVNSQTPLIDGSQRLGLDRLERDVRSYPRIGQPQ
jgi:hypothetical protein